MRAFARYARAAPAIPAAVSDLRLRPRRERSLAPSRNLRSSRTDRAGNSLTDGMILSRTAEAKGTPAELAWAPALHSLGHARASSAAIALRAGRASFRRVVRRGKADIARGRGLAGR